MIQTDLGSVILIHFTPKKRTLSNGSQETTSVKCPYSIPQTCHLGKNFTRSYPSLYVVPISTNGNPTNKVPFLVKRPTSESNLTSMGKSYCSQSSLLYTLVSTRFRWDVWHGIIRYRTLKNTRQSHSRVNISQCLIDTSVIEKR